MSAPNQDPTPTPRPGQPEIRSFRTAGGLQVSRKLQHVDGPAKINEIIDRLDRRRGVLLASSFEFPGRYTRFDIGFVDPPLQLTARGRELTIEALNERGKILVQHLESRLAEIGSELLKSFSATSEQLSMTIADGPDYILEEERSRVPSVFSLIRILVEHLGYADDGHFGLYGAFGYDLAFQCDSIELALPRAPEHRDLVLFVPDRIVEIDHAQGHAIELSYEFEHAGVSSHGLPRETEDAQFVAAAEGPRRCDHNKGEYADIVRKAHDYFARGDLFETVPSQTFSQPCTEAPSAIFRRLRQSTPAPYGLFVNLGADEWLVGASPEMYLRTQGRRIETCPIAGTIKRSSTAVGDAEQIRTLLNSEKEESELTMCTDVDRNDKSRVCVPQSVRVIGRRQIEVYSKLIHTVDHVEGLLAEGFDGLDAFIAHTWAVTVTGAPKLSAMQFIENHEKSPRAWYGGAIGKIGFDGNLNTGLTLRTIRILQGTAQVRAGATLLFDSDPEAEAAETELKASALLEALSPKSTNANLSRFSPTSGRGKRVLLVDHRDSFVHTLANYMRQTGAEVSTTRPGFPDEQFELRAPDLVWLSPGPGRPDDFDLADTIRRALARNLPIFGVCLGLQGIVEYFGGRLDTLGYPVHGKPSVIHREDSPIFSSLPQSFSAGRYHSLIAEPGALPDCLRVTAKSEGDGSIMALEHRELPIAAVQFHPESILSHDGDIGLRIIDNALRHLCR